MGGLVEGKTQIHIQIELLCNRAAKIYLVQGTLSVRYRLLLGTELIPWIRGLNLRELKWAISSGVIVVSRNPEAGLESLLTVFMVMAQWGPKRGHCRTRGSGVLDKHTSLVSLTRSSSNHVSRCSKLSMFIGLYICINKLFNNLFFKVLDICTHKLQSHFALTFASKTKQTTAL